MTLFKIDRIFNPISLLLVNILIIICVEFAGEGTLFYRTGLIHVIAVLFIVLSVSRIFIHYHTYDPILERFVRAAMAALVIFAVSHIVEFASLVIFDVYEDATFAAVANLYGASMLAIAAGAEFFLKAYHRRSPLFMMALLCALALLCVFTVVILANDSLISLEPDGVTPYAYAAVMACIGFIGLLQIWRIRRLVPLARGFSSYLAAAIALVMTAALVSIFYELLVDRAGFSEMQAIYLSHFLFYAALSVMFLAFRKLSYLGELYEEIGEINRASA